MFFVAVMQALMLDAPDMTKGSAMLVAEPQHFAPGMMNFFNSLFSTHPDTKKRIEILEQF